MQEGIAGSGEKGWKKWEKETTKIIPMAFLCLWFKPNYYTWEKKGFYIAGKKKKKSELICVVFISQKRGKSKQYVGKV